MDRKFKVDVPPFIRRLAATAKCKIYIVGGFIRNAALNLGNTDIDICGALLPEELGVDAEVIPINKRLGTALITDGVTKAEYTPRRKESYGPGGEHSPLAVSFGATIAEDVRRRDFTAGSVYYDVSEDRFVDPYGGLADIADRILRAKDPEFTFADDGLRLMRLCRLAAETGFSIDGNTAAVAKKFAHRLKDISPERKKAELDRILVADFKYGVKDAHYRGLCLMREFGLWQYVLPSVAAMDGVKQNPKYHLYDVMEHSFMAVRYAPADVRLAALMHDVGKPPCMAKDGNTYNHPQVGAEIVKVELGQNGLKYPNAVVEEVALLTRLHMYDMQGNAKESKVRIFVAEHFDIIPKLVALIKADGKATGTKEEIITHRFTVVYKKLIEENAPVKLSMLKVDGNDVVASGIKGKQVSETLKLLWRECILDPTRNDRRLLLGRIKREAKRHCKAKNGNNFINSQSDDAEV